MDSVTLQAHIYAGRGKAAIRIGLDCRQYRPLLAGVPFGNLIATIKSAFNSGDPLYKSPNLFGDPVWYADLDGRATQPGDYLVRVADGSTWYIAAQQQLLPIVCIECNRALRISRQALVVGAVGLQGYGSSSPCDPASMGDILGVPGSLWPASILLGGRSRNSEAHLPAGVKQSGWRIMLPASVPAVLTAGDIATDDLGRRYVFEAAEMTDMGWRINAIEVHA